MMRAGVIVLARLHDGRRWRALTAGGLGPKCSPRTAVSTIDRLSGKERMMNILTSLVLLVSQFPSTTIPDFPEAMRRKAVVATVKIVKPDGGQGSGVLIGREGAFAYILTASHVVGTATTVEVQVFTEQSLPKVAATHRGATVLARAA